MSDKHGYRERRLRAYPPITLEELAAATDPPVHASTIARLETDDTANPTRRVMHSIRDALNTLEVGRSAGEALEA